MKHTDFERKNPVSNPPAKLQELANLLYCISNMQLVGTIAENIHGANRIVHNAIVLVEYEDFHKVIEHLETAKVHAATIRCLSFFEIVLAEHAAWEIYADVTHYGLEDEAVSPIGTIVPKKEVDSAFVNVWNELAETYPADFQPEPVAAGMLQRTVRNDR
jgi:hypothetical protein